MTKRSINYNMELRRHVWHIILEVPPSLRPVMGKKRLVKSTRTREEALARVRRHTILAELRGRVERARPNLGQAGDSSLTGQALGWRRDLAADLDPHDRASLEIAVVDQAERLEPVIGFAAAKSFVDVALGHATPLTHHLEEWLAQTTYKDRQKADVRNSFEKLAAWLASRDLGSTLETVTDRMASTYVAEAMVNAGMNPKTANKHMSFLRVHWAWLKSHGYFDGPNPWTGKSLKKPQPSADELERPFTDEEVVSLFNGPADEDMRDLMAVGALSGMRLEEIYQLQAKHCREGVFKITKGKTSVRFPFTPSCCPSCRGVWKGRGMRNTSSRMRRRAGETRGRAMRRSGSRPIARSRAWMPSSKASVGRSLTSTRFAVGSSPKLIRPGAAKMTLSVWSDISHKGKAWGSTRAASP